MSALVDWELAGRIARVGVGAGPARMAGSIALEPLATRAQRSVVDYTGLEPTGTVPTAEWVSRSEWIEISLESMRDLVGAIEERVGTDAPGVAEGPLGAVTKRVAAVEIGGLLGLASRRVLGQYDVALLGGDRPPRLLFLGENIAIAAEGLDGRPTDVLAWIALHEVTHAVHFAAAPWLREHMGGLARTLITESPVRVSPAEILGRARKLTSTDPRRLLAELRSSDPLTLLAPAESRETIAAVQTAMAAIEGYAEHVMDAAAADVGPAVPKLRAAMDRRRETRSAPGRLLAWLLGFELKLRQYREGKRFCDAIVAEAGIDALNRAWKNPAELPSAAELADPPLWLARA